MGNETEAGTQTFDSSSDMIDLKLGQEPEMDTQGTETSAGELTYRSGYERIKQATNPIFRRVEELCAPLIGRTEMESAGNSEASGWKRDNASASPSPNLGTTSEQFITLIVSENSKVCVFYHNLARTKNHKLKILLFVSSTNVAQ